MVVFGMAAAVWLDMCTHEQHHHTHTHPPQRAQATRVLDSSPFRQGRGGTRLGGRWTERPLSVGIFNRRGVRVGARETTAGGRRGSGEWEEVVLRNEPYLRSDSCDVMLE